tara:strand:- start:118 stop:594 length:477 start_codon:yes stop_codon:yes gene_type:complete
MSLGETIVKVANQLFELSNTFVELRCDIGMPMLGYSFIEPDIHGLYRPVIVLNPRIIPDDCNVIAHILGHEWGHHVLRHIEPRTPNMAPEGSNRRQEKENEADAYAARFIKTYNYDIDAIISFLREHPFDLENRMQILLNTPADRNMRSSTLNSSLSN